MPINNPHAEVWHKLLDDNQRMAEALQAIRDGHNEGITFLKKVLDREFPLPNNLQESIAMAEAIARVALTPTNASYDVPATLYRNMLIRYGQHQDYCQGYQPNDNLCDCGFDAIEAELGHDPEAQENLEHEMLPDTKGETDDEPE